MDHEARNDDGVWCCEAHLDCYLADQYRAAKRRLMTHTHELHRAEDNDGVVYMWCDCGWEFIEPEAPPAESDDE